MDEQPQDIIQPVVAKKFPTIAIVLISVVVAGVVFGAAGYFGANYLLTGKKTTLTAQITKLTIEKTDLQAKLDEATKIIADQTTELGKSQAQADIPRVVYSPEGLFTIDDKKMLNEKVILAYEDYYSAEIGVNDPVQMLIVKKDVVKDTAPIYTFEMVHAQAFSIFKLVLNKDNVYPAWYPACMFTDCRDVPQKFAEKYPNLLAVAEGLKPSNQTQSIAYTNSKYNFTLTLPATWAGYTTKDRTFSAGTTGTINSIDFGFAAQDALFNVSVYSKSQWKEIQANEGRKPGYLGENSQYVFGYETSQDVANDTMIARLAEIQDIVKTFKLK